MIANTPAELPRMPLEPIRPEEGREDSAYNARMTDRMPSMSNEWQNGINRLTAALPGRKASLRSLSEL